MMFDPAPVIRQLQLTVPARPGLFNESANHRRSSPFDPHPRPSIEQMAEVAGVSRRTVYRWMRGERIRRGVADQIAVRLGLHPCELWPEFMDVAS